MNDAHVYRRIALNRAKQPIEVRFRRAFLEPAHWVEFFAAREKHGIPGRVLRIYRGQLVRQARIEQALRNRLARRGATKLGQSDDVRIPFEYLLDDLAGASCRRRA